MVNSKKMQSNSELLQDQEASYFAAVNTHMMRPLSICKKKKSKEKAGRIKRLDHPHIRGLDTKRSMVRLEKSVLPENRNQKRVNESVLTVESTMT